MSLDIQIGAPLTPNREKALKALGRLLGREAHGDPEPSVLVGTLLAPEKSGTFSLQFHIDKESGKTPWFYGHFVLQDVSTSPTPPKRVSELRTAGHTTEWLMAEIGTLFRKSRGELPTQTILQAKVPYKLPLGLPNTAILDDFIFAPTSIEFTRASTSVSVNGPQSIAIHVGPTESVIRIRHRHSAKWNTHPWLLETIRCAKLLDQFLPVLK